MELKVHRDTKITIGLTEEEAQQVLALLNIPRRGVLPIADELFDALHDSDVALDVPTFDTLQDHFAEVYSE